jgi:hypothetical protein
VMSLSSSRKVDNVCKQVSLVSSVSQRLPSNRIS